MINFLVKKPEERLVTGRERETERDLNERESERPERKRERDLRGRGREK